MSISGAPARYDRAMPSPVQISALVVGSYSRPRPPAAMMTAFALMIWRTPVIISSGHYAVALPILNYQGGDKPLLVDADGRLDHLLVHNVEHGLPREVRHEECTGSLLSTEGPGAQMARLIPAEDDPHVLLLYEWLVPPPGIAPLWRPGLPR